MGNWIMKSNEFIAERDEHDLRGLTFAELGAKRATIHMGEFTNAIGEFYEYKGVVVDGPGFTSTVEVKSNSAPAIKDAKQAFVKFFNVSAIRGVSQSQYGFTFSVAELTPDQYAELLEKTLRFFDFKK